ncbi:CASPASE_P20 domain-containing protein [Nephila pilipes]|uniref:CASPASE_P20 domain-containing protein n=1 Tax=Nephila pilipes TaxID=299642 RepID=A0A8X6U6K7_NEPPI|nr:CASPASE_P20 domain-containing protein [Nephila pilipes]
MLDDIWNGEALLLEELPTRGPTAFSKFIEILRDNGFGSKADEILRAEASEYIISQNQRGYCIIINNEVCHKPDEDDIFQYAHDIEAKALDIALSTIGYSSPEFKRNLCPRDLISVLTEFSQKDFSKADSCIVIILSNGARKMNSNFIFDINGECIVLNEILNLFTDSKCPSLKYKPKIFLLPSFDGSYNFSNSVNSLKSVKLLPDVNDIFIWHFPPPKAYNLFFEELNQVKFFGQVLSKNLEHDFLECDFEKVMNNAYNEFFGKFSVERDLHSISACTKIGNVKEKITFSITS